MPTSYNDPQRLITIEGDPVWSFDRDANALNVVGASTSAARGDLTPSGGYIYFNQATGSSGGDGSIGDPYQTWAQARAAWSAGDVIVQQDGGDLAINVIDAPTMAANGQAPVLKRASIDLRSDWAESDTGNDFIGAHCAASPEENAIVYCVQQIVRRSLDGGASWAASTGIPSGSKRHVYYSRIFKKFFMSADAGIYTSADGAAFTQIYASVSEVCAAAIDGPNGKTFFLTYNSGTSTITIRETSNGTTTSLIATINPPAGLGGINVSSFGFAAGRLAFGVTGGISAADKSCYLYSSQTAGASWQFADVLAPLGIPGVSAISSIVDFFGECYFLVGQINENRPALLVKTSNFNSFQAASSDPGITRFLTGGALQGGNAASRLLIVSGGVIGVAFLSSTPANNFVKFFNRGLEQVYEIDISYTSPLEIQPNYSAGLCWHGARFISIRNAGSNGADVLLENHGTTIKDADILGYTTGGETILAHQGHATGTGEIINCTSGSPLNIIESAGVKNCVFSGGAETHLAAGIITDSVFQNLKVVNQIASDDFEIAKTTVAGIGYIQNIKSDNETSIKSAILNGGILAYDSRTTAENSVLRGYVSPRLQLASGNFNLDPLFLSPPTDYRLATVAERPQNSPYLGKSTLFAPNGSAGTGRDLGAYSFDLAGLVESWTKAVVLPKPASSSFAIKPRAFYTPTRGGDPSGINRPNQWVEEISVAWTQLDAGQFAELMSLSIQESVRVRLTWDSILSTSSVTVSGNQSAGSPVLVIADQAVTPGSFVTIDGKKIYVYRVIAGSPTTLVLSSNLPASVTNGDVLPLTNVAGAGEYIMRWPDIERSRIQYARPLDDSNWRGVKVSFERRRALA